MNFGSLRPPLFLNFLTQETWQQIGAALRLGHIPRVTEQMFCDGLLSYQNANSLMTVATLGTVAELELNDLVRDLRAVGRRAARKSIGKRNFEWKLKEGPQLYGARPFHGTRMPNAVEDIITLYHKRGDVVHSGELNVQAGEIARFIFAVQELLFWARKERERAGCPIAGPTPILIPHIVGG